MRSGSGGQKAGPDMISIAEILSPAGVVVDMKPCGSKRPLLKELAERAATLVGTDSRRLLKALLERERLGSTGIGHGIAIPHARLDEMERVVSLFARLDHAVEFEAPDDQPCDLIFLILAPNFADAESLNALDRVARALRDPGLRQWLRQTQDAEMVYQMPTEKPESHAA
jgi:PTS system nitrogen regulatory IIA component